MLKNSPYTEMNHPFLPNMCFHLYNHANGNHNIFFSDENRKHFLRRFDKYLYSYLSIHVFCLMPNHFHLLVTIHSSENILKQAKIDYPHGLTNKEYPILKDLQRLQALDELEAAAIISERLRVCLMSYSKGINKQEDRKGSLFRKFIRRKPILTNNYFKCCVAYIHLNPKYHFGIDEWQQWEWSSYKRILLKEQTHLAKEQTLEVFDGIIPFLQHHEIYDEYRDEEDNWFLEE